MGRKFFWCFPWPNSAFSEGLIGDLLRSEGGGGAVSTKSFYSWRCGRFEGDLGNCCLKGNIQPKIGKMMPGENCE